LKWRLARPASNLRFRWFGFRIGPGEPLLTEAIRSVTHLVLALGRGQFDGTSISNRKERARNCFPGPGSFRLGFLGHQSFSSAAPFWQAAESLASRPIPIPSGIQKTFSAGPCSFTTLELWFPGSARRAAGSNLLLTHDTVESPAKPFLAVAKEQRAAASNHSGGSIVQPVHWLAAALKNQLVFITRCFPGAATSHQPTGL